MARMDLALYADPGAEKLFLQDLYAALNAPGEMVLFDHYESCCPAFLKTLADLAVKGAAPLASRYLVNREGHPGGRRQRPGGGGGQPDHPAGQVPDLFLPQGPGADGRPAGRGLCGGLGDVCSTQPFTQESLQALAARLLNELARRCARQLQLTLTAGEDVRDYVVSRHTGKLGGPRPCPAAASASSGAERILPAAGQLPARKGRSGRPGTGCAAVFHQRQRACPAGRPAARRLGRRDRGGQAGNWMRWWVWTRSSSTCSAWPTMSRSRSGGRPPASRRPACPCT